MAATFAKERGVMVNSGSSALYLAVELLRPQPGRRDHHLAGDVLHRYRADGEPGSPPVFIDVTPNTYQLDTGSLERRSPTGPSPSSCPT
ncbi:hypothetical protein [Candidatus Neomicrothrix sp.]|uniref:hypothetical protein n=1 Tax=Candidatus Neomicrothrix sp. TaxID=2719034 RepID=UPI0025BF39AF|nr:hypothetical protein [Candidatus Microthrix sp.]